jgi:hypothetical protein
MNKKGMELTMNTIVIAIICLIVLAVVIIIFVTYVNKNNPDQLNVCETQKGGSCSGAMIPGQMCIKGLGCPKGEEICCYANPS